MSRSSSVSVGSNASKSSELSTVRFCNMQQALKISPARKESTRRGIARQLNFCLRTPKKHSIIRRVARCFLLKVSYSVVRECPPMEEAAILSKSSRYHQEVPRQEMASNLPQKQHATCCYAERACRLHVIVLRLNMPPAAGRRQPYN